MGHRAQSPCVSTVIQLTDELDQRESPPCMPAMFRLYLVLSRAYLCGRLV